MLHLKKYFSVQEQHNLVDMIRNIAKVNGGMTIPVMPSGQKFTVAKPVAELLAGYPIEKAIVIPLSIQ
jgi:hypothetical protein